LLISPIFYMNRPYTFIGSAVIVLILIAVGAYAYSQHRNEPSGAVISTATYLCRDGKTMDASFREGSVILTLSDTRALVLPQAVSGSGIRYEKDTVAFVSKGNNAFLTEGDETTYADCVENGSAQTSQAGTRQFSDSAGTFTFTYPDTVTVSGGEIGYTDSWMTNATSSGILLAKALLSNTTAPKTNFSNATLTVGTSANPTAVSTCLTHNPSGGAPAAPTTKTINGVTFTVLTSSDAGAGNRYDTTSYRVVRNNQCYVVEYTIHSTNIQNYDESQGIKEFDRNAVASVLENIIASFEFTDGAH
jgi:membrane-bound inhibitor of C-type lysozyme